MCDALIFDLAGRPLVTYSSAYGYFTFPGFVRQEDE